MFSIQSRLKLLFVVIVTVVLAISGTWSQRSLERELEGSYQRLRYGVLTRLQISLPSALWDLDKTKVDDIVEAELLPPEVTAIRVYDSSVGLFAGTMRAPDGTLVPVAAPALAPKGDVSAVLTLQNGAGGGAPVKVGTVVVSFSRAGIDAALSSQMMRKIIEVLLLDVVLILALSLSLRVVFAPLQQLRERLFELATRGTGEVEELPEQRRDELGEVIRGFNMIQRRLKSTIVRIREAEDTALRASKEAALALDDLRQTQESLMEAERLASLGSLVAGVAHEINTPVGITLTSASVLKEATDKIQAAVANGGLKKSEIMGYLDTASESATLIMNNAYRAAHLIHSFKQIAVDQASEERRRFGLGEYIGEIISSLQPKLKKGALKLHLDCPVDIVLDSYPGAFAQVVTNLLLNCVDHAFKADVSGQIRIGARVVGEQVEVYVDDDGLGIPPNVLERVFDPFFTTRRGQGGTGLGLNIVYNLVVKQFGGAIAVSSTPGEGTRFTLCIPRVTPVQERKADTAAARAHSVNAVRSHSVSAARAQAPETVDNEWDGT
ncbi:sensor histidine kinase [Massilia glaciei]|uniref:histidine kinase n=1 Tax=Massilia glaciei TaxID=1524097 RepID=A0A2U2HP62_9BURK|nr:HAMP domain-containing sensor histidine kinase [Massilia glaciei]PWF49283.1 histidine kinase [Massilia glaciei]